MNSYPILKKRLLQLKEQAAEADKCLHTQPKFSPALFQCRAKTLTPYVSEALNLLNELHHMAANKLNSASSGDTMTYLSDKLVDQTEAIRKVLDGDNVRETAKRKDTPPPAISDDLYLALEQHKEWERRLTLALHQKEKWYRSLPEGQKQEAKAVVVNAAQRLLRCQESRQHIEQRIDRPSVSDLNQYT